MSRRNLLSSPPTTFDSWKNFDLLMSCEDYYMENVDPPIYTPITGNNSTSDNNITYSTNGDTTPTKGDYTENPGALIDTDIQSGSIIGEGTITPTLKSYHTEVYKGYDEWWESAIIPTMHGSYSHPNTPIGAKVIPESHDLYGDGTAGYASLYYMDGYYSQPTIASTGANGSSITLTEPSPITHKSLIASLNNARYTYSALSAPDKVNIDKNNVINGMYSIDSIIPFNIIPHDYAPRFSIKSSAFNKVGYCTFWNNGIVTDTTNGGGVTHYTDFFVNSPFLGDYYHKFNYNIGTTKGYVTSPTTQEESICQNCIIQGVSKWHLPSIQELIYLCSQWKAYNDLTYNINDARYKYKLFISNPSPYSAYYELINLSTWNNGSSCVNQSFSFNLLSSTPAFTNCNSMFYIEVSDSGPYLQFQVCVGSDIRGYIIPFKNV